MAKKVYIKKRFAMWLKPETQRLIDAIGEKLAAEGVPGITTPEGEYVDAQVISRTIEKYAELVGIAGEQKEPA